MTTIDRRLTELERALDQQPVKQVDIGADLQAALVRIYGDAPEQEPVRVGDDFRLHLERIYGGDNGND